MLGLQIGHRRRDTDSNKEARFCPAAQDSERMELSSAIQSLYFGYALTLGGHGFEKGCFGKRFPYPFLGSRVVAHDVSFTIKHGGNCSFGKQQLVECCLESTQIQRRIYDADDLTISVKKWITNWKAGSGPGVGWLVLANREPTTLKNALEMQATPKIGFPCLAKRG